ncbi:PepSY domain-containing protein [Niabella sp. CC-SYL272]|uniref:PepSY-associated TM helix domain-containing protein n=1 Tax=Niabella agricola TaxID=2891571 RepID=UPI001F2C4F85|nr:PepSY-associated TM helix domain-containing protein [Niabella agricola]MCF3110638.1 PepSY domain-containing protein [Niabella agricola]
MFRLSSKSRFKKVIRWLHLWLGLASGLVFFIMGITGAIYSFQPELSRLTQPYLSVKAEQRPYLPVSQLQVIAAKELPGKQPSRIIYYAKDQAVTVHFIRRGKASYYWAVFLNPYTGEVLKTRDMDTEFFRFILRGHMYLWLPPSIGKPVVATCTVIFTLIVVSGLILWWPRNRNARKSSYTVKFRASPKRLNYDLHRILGFYASWVLVFILATGLAWSFETVMKAEYWLFSGGRGRPAPPKFISRNEGSEAAGTVIDKILYTARQGYPGIEHYQVRLPDSDSAAVQVILYLKEGRYAPADNLYFNQYTGERFVAKNWGLYAAANAGEKANRMTYDIHTGGIGGLAGRTLVFFTGLIAASLPVTGFCIWLGKRRKRRQQKEYYKKKQV